MLISKEYYDIVYSRVPERSKDTFNKDLIECLKYLAIMSLTKGRRIVVTPEVDDVWHELIVQTKNYENLCKALPGERFIHHTSITPSEYEGVVGSKEFVDEFLKWIPDYIQNFGKFTEENIKRWTVTQFLVNNIKIPIDELNNLGDKSQAEVKFDSDWVKCFNNEIKKISKY